MTKELLFSLWTMDETHVTAVKAVLLRMHKGPLGILQMRVLSVRPPGRPLTNYTMAAQSMLITPAAKQMRIRVNKAAIHIQELANKKEDSVTSRGRTSVWRVKIKLVCIRGIAGSRDRNRKDKKFIK